MSTEPSSPDPAYARQAAQRDRFLVLLNDLVDMNVDLARRIQVQSHTESPASLAVPLERITRSARRTMALADKYAEPLKAPAAERRAAERRSAAREATRQLMYRDVEDVIQRRAETDEDEQSLHEELRERIDAPDMAHEIDNRPAAHIIRDLLRDLGLAHIPGTHPWARRTPADIADLKRRAAEPRPTTGPP